MLITNSDYQYTDRMMSHAYDRYLEAEGMTWRDIFDMVCGGPPSLAPLPTAPVPSRPCLTQQMHLRCSDEHFSVLSANSQRCKSMQKRDSKQLRSTADTPGPPNLAWHSKIGKRWAPESSVINMTDVQCKPQSLCRTL